LRKPTNVLTLIASAEVPAENITMIRLHVSNAMVAVKDSSGLVSVKTVVVPSEMLKIPLSPDARISGQMTTSIIVDRPHIVVDGTNQISLTPVLHVDSVNGPR
jgi:N-glycosylase/DNA lyase